MKTGVILARLQPIHNGHLALIKKSISENDETLVLIGSADKFNQRNPIPINVRQDLVTEACKDICPEGKTLRIVALEDLTNETDNSHDWGFYLYAKIVELTKNPIFTIYYSDGFEIITTWFPGFMMKDYISLSLLARNSVESGISATKVREMIMEDNSELKDCVPACVYNSRTALKQYIELSKLIK